MNKKEVLEIRKQFSPKNCAITRICGCYVDHEKNKKMESKEAFLSLPEEEAFKYFDIFKKTLSGSIGKNMINMEFPIDAEMPGGTQEFLLKLRDSRLEDDMLLEEFYDKASRTVITGDISRISRHNIPYDLIHRIISLFLQSLIYDIKNILRRNLRSRLYLKELRIT